MTPFLYSNFGFCSWHPCFSYKFQYLCWDHRSSWGKPWPRPPLSSSISALNSSAYYFTSSVSLFTFPDCKILSCYWGVGDYRYSSKYWNRHWAWWLFWRKTLTVRTAGCDYQPLNSNFCPLVPCSLFPVCRWPKKDWGWGPSSYCNRVLKS